MRALFVILIFAVSSFAQTGATLDLQIQTSRGLPVSAARIILLPGSLVSSTDAQGRTNFCELSAGHYTLEIKTDDQGDADTSLYLQATEHKSIKIVLHSVINLPEVIVEDSPYALSLQIYDHNAIEQSSAKSLTEFLSRHAGLDVREDGSPGGVQAAKIGGSNANQVLVLLDGRKVMNLGSGENDLSSVPIDWVESVKIKRGGQTELGGEAIGGIIEITTRQNNLRNEISLSENIYPTFHQANISRGGNLGGLFAFGSFVRTQGKGNYLYKISEEDGNDDFTDNLGKEYRRQNNDVVRDQLFLKFSNPQTSNWQISLSGSLDRSDRGMPGYLAPLLTPLARQQTEQNAINLYVAKSSRHTNIAARVSHQSNSKYFENPDPFSFVKLAKESNQIIDGEIYGKTKWSDALISGGGQTVFESISGDQLLNSRASRERYAIWSQWRQSYRTFDHFRLYSEAGLRVEQFKTNGVEWLPKFEAGLEYSALYRITSSFSWGKSYHAPTFYSLFWSEDQVAQGNPDLSAENSDEFIGSLRLETTGKSKSTLEVNASQQNISDLIYWKKSFDNLWRPYNLKSAVVKTLDIGLNQSIWNDGIRLSGGVNWTEAKDNTSDRTTGGKYLTFRPLQTYRLNLSAKTAGFELSGSYRYASKRAVLETNSKWLNPYELFDLGLAYNQTVGQVYLKPSFEIRNLFNENYRIIRFAPMPLREYTLSLQIIWNTINS